MTYVLGQAQGSPIQRVPQLKTIGVVRNQSKQD